MRLISISARIKTASFIQNELKKQKISISIACINVSPSVKEEIKYQLNVINESAKF